jgi:hypothetical protein
MVARRLSGQDITYSTLPPSPKSRHARARPKPIPKVDAQGYTQLLQTEDEDGYTKVLSPTRRDTGGYEYAEFVRPASSSARNDHGYVVPNPRR